MMSTFDQHGVQYLTAIASAFTYNYMGWFREIITLPARWRRVDGIRRGPRKSRLIMKITQTSNTIHPEKKENKPCQE